jgi:uncharacterized membrane protein YphA (DoxX/SURF4 family)
MSVTGKTGTRTHGWLLFIRIFIASFLFLHSIGQLMSFWQASQIISSGAFPDLVLLQNAALPIVFFIGAVMLMIGFKTKITAIVLLPLLAGTSVLAWVLVGAPDSPLTWGLRLWIIVVLLDPAIFGAGRWSVDGLIAARLAARDAQ